MDGEGRVRETTALVLLTALLKFYSSQLFSHEREEWVRWKQKLEERKRRGYIIKKAKAVVTLKHRGNQWIILKYICQMKISPKQVILVRSCEYHSTTIYSHTHLTQTKRNYSACM